MTELSNRRSGRAGRTYFAAEPFNAPEFGKKLLSKVQDYESHALVRRIDARLAQAYLHYYGYSPDGFHATSIVARAGAQGELAQIRVNHARALVHSLLNLIIKDKFVWQPRASNYSYEAVRQTELAASVLEHYWHNFKVKQITDRAVEEAIAFTEGFVLLEWDEEAGIPLPDPANPQGIIRSGNLRYWNVSSWDVIRDPYARTWDELRWIIVRTMRNRYDIIARIEKRKDLDENQKYALIQGALNVNNPLTSGTTRGTNSRDWESDEIPVFQFYHKPDAVLQFGRETHFMADGQILLDEPMDLDCLPLFRVAPAELIGTPFGYSQYLEILGLQEMADAIYSSLATNISTFATQSIIIEEGTNVQVEDLAGGMKVLYRPQGSEHKDAIMPLQLTRSPPEAFTFLSDLKNQQELLMGLNETVRGQVQSDRLSGSAMALLDTQALRQASALGNNYIKLVQELGTATIKMIRKRANTPLKISMVGKSKMSLIHETEITGGDLSEVDQIFVDIGNPMTQTASGRFDLASQLLQMKALTSADQMIEVLETGRLESATRAQTEEQRNILRENELIIEGQKPIVMLHDNHLEHGRQHCEPVSSPEARLNPDVIKCYTDHMHDHYLQFFGTPPGQYVPNPDPNAAMMGGPATIFQQTDPLYRERMLILSGQQPPPPMMPPMPMGGPPGMPPPGGMAPPGPGAPPQPTPAQGTADAAGPGSAPPANLPQPPTNPVSGSKWNPVNGGAPATGPAVP